MLPLRYTFIATLVLCGMAVLAICFLNFLNKEGQLVARIPGGELMLTFPFLGIAVGAVVWRQNRWLSVLGLVVAIIAGGCSVYGKAIDYLAWSQAPPGQEAMYFAGFLTMLLAWVLCFAFWGAGLTDWFISRGTQTKQVK